MTWATVDFCFDVFISDCFLVLHGVYECCGFINGVDWKFLISPGGTLISVTSIKLVICKPVFSTCDSRMYEGWVEIDDKSIFSLSHKTVRLGIRRFPSMCSCFSRSGIMSEFRRQKCFTKNYSCIYALIPVSVSSPSGAHFVVGDLFLKILFFGRTRTLKNLDTFYLEQQRLGTLQGRSNNIIMQFEMSSQDRSVSSFH